MEQLIKLKDIIAKIEKEMPKYSRGTDAAGLRIRKLLKDLTLTAHEFRAESLKKNEE